ncbi:MAG: hypothetical protein FWD76_00310 [Firmicutes bacterium]|nr:hypothetical protein [Bacillota bacterium]
MGWFEASVTGMTAALTALTSTTGMLQITITPAKASAIIAGIGAFIGIMKAAMPGMSSEAKKAQQEAGKGTSPSTGIGAYASASDGNNAINQYQSPMQQRSGGSMDLNINMSRADVYNQQGGKDIASELSVESVERLGTGDGAQIIGGRGG